MKDINKLNKRDVENEIIKEFSISLILISKTLFERYIKIEMIINYWNIYQNFLKLELYKFTFNLFYTKINIF